MLSKYEIQYNTIALMVLKLLLPLGVKGQFSECATIDLALLKGKSSANETLSTQLSIPRSTTFGKFPNNGNINALVVFIKFKDKNYEDLRTFDGYKTLGEPTFTNTGLNYSNDTLIGRKTSLYRDSWQVGGQQSWTDDPITEWPRNLPMINDRKQQLPNWANTFIDDFESSNTTAGSMTDILFRASNGQLNLRT